MWLVWFEGDWMNGAKLRVPPVEVGIGGEGGGVEC